MPPLLNGLFNSDSNDSENYSHTNADTNDDAMLSINNQDESYSRDQDGSEHSSSSNHDINSDLSLENTLDNVTHTLTDSNGLGDIG